MSKEFAAGASAAIARTVNDIENILAGEKLKISGSKREALRKKIQMALTKSSRSWFKKGFNRGHKEAFRAHKTHGQVPEILEVEVEREFVSNTMSRVPLKSTLTEAFCKKA